MTTPVRWKLLPLTVVFAILAHLTQAAKIESVSMADDGWRPIVGSVGTQRDGPYDEITHYRNPASKKSDPVKAKPPIQEKPVAPPTTLPKLEPKKIPAPGPILASNLSPVPKMAPHSKPMFLVPANLHPQLALGPMQMHHHRPHKYSHLMKIHHHAKPPPRAKPQRHQVPAFSTRDEVFVPAPSSNIGPYTFYSASQPPLKSRPTHIEFTNHFPIPHSEDELYQIVRAPVHQYVIPKTPISNDVHFTFQNPDDFHRNISPYKFESNKEKVKKVKDVPRHEALKNVHPFHLSTQQPNQVDVQVTKEKLKVFHNAIPSNYNPLEDYEYRPVKQHTPSHKHHATYEVTEGKWNQETPIFQYHYTTPPKLRVPTRVITEESKPFLPTPVKPDSVPPTLPTESEISTIYNQVKINRQKSEFSTPTPINFFDVKEVSTHFPILGPPEYQTISYPTRLLVNNDEKENEITTRQSIIEQYQREQEREQEQQVNREREHEQETTTYRPQVRNPINRRPLRRRRPTSTTTTPQVEVEEAADVEQVTDFYEPQKMETSAEVTTQRIRRPSRYRSTTSTTTTTTTPQPEVETTSRVRQRRPRPTTTEEPQVDLPDNHKIEYESLEEKFSRLTTTTERDFPANFESHFTAPFKSDPPPQTTTTEESIPFRGNKYTNPPVREEKPATEESDSEESEVRDSASAEESDEKGEVEEVEDKILEDYRVQYHESQKTPEEISINPEITLNTPENEVDFTTRNYFSTKMPRVEETTFMEIPTTTTTTTTTTEAPKRVRGRPVKYDNSNRPRFSVKEYRQRLTTSSTTTETPKTQNEVMRIRFPNRSRRPITPSPTSSTTLDDEHDPKSKFHPKDPRHPNLDQTTEKLKFNTVNTRIRPFGRYKSTTEASVTTSRVSIKPNIFSNLRRPTPISLKTRIYNRNGNRNSTTIKPEPEVEVEVTTIDNIPDDNNETDQTELVETTIPYSVEESDVNVSTEFGVKKVDVAMTDAEREVKNEEFMQSQIVSDLTSSAKNEYNKPGLFKNVQPNSRKVPSYFTLATEDPILPIEAFFPNLKDKQ